MFKSARSQRGMMMLEVLISMLIFAIGVIGMLRMQAIASANSVNSEDRATAATLASDLISELWANNSASAPTDYSAWQTRVTGSLRGGSGALATAGTQATVTITWTPQGRASTDTSVATYSTQVFIQ